MKRKNKSKYLIIAIVLIISIGFAFLSARLDINGLANIKKIGWNIYFDNVQNNFGQEFEVTAPTTSGTNTTEIYFEVELEDPGDSYSFDVDIVNNGTIDAMYKLTYDWSSYDTDYSDLYIFDVTYKNGNSLQANNLLAKKSRDTITVTITYNRNIDISSLPSEDRSTSYYLVLNYEQAKNADNHSTKHFDIVDLSGNGIDGTNNGATNNGNGTYTFDGVDDTITVGLENYDFKNSISTVMRFKLLSYDGTTEYGILGNVNSAGVCLKLVGAGSPRLIFHNGSAYVGSNASTLLSLDTWYTVVATYDGEKIKIYINGEKDYLQNNSYEYPVTGNITPSSSPFKINGFIANSNMIVSDMLIFDRALTEEEVSLYYADTVNPVDKTKLLVYYDFN